MQAATSCAKDAPRFPSRQDSGQGEGTKQAKRCKATPYCEMLLFWVGCFGCVFILFLFCFWFLPAFYRVDLVFSLRPAASSSSSRRLPKSHTQHHTPNITHSTSHIQLEAKGGGRKLASKGRGGKILPIAAFLSPKLCLPL